MGVEWGEQLIVIKPYRGTRTLRNLRATGAAVVNLTDDILLFSQAALRDPHPAPPPAAPPDRRHVPVQPGVARRPAPANPSRRQRRRRGAGRCLLVARGAGGGDRRERA